MLKVLQDLEETSLHSVEILKHFVVSTMIIVDEFRIVKTVAVEGAITYLVYIVSENTVVHV